MSALFPIFSVPTAAQGGQLPLYTDVAMDYAAGTPRWESGQPVVVSGLEAVKSWAWRAIATARYRYAAFSWDYGCEIESLAGQPYQAETKRSEAARYVTEALLVSPYITACADTDVTFDGSTFHMTVEFSTIYGKERLYV